MNKNVNELNMILFFIFDTKIQKLDFKFIAWTTLDKKKYKEGPSHIFPIEEAN